MKKIRTSELHSGDRKDKKKMRFLVVGMFLVGMSKLKISKKLRVPRSTIFGQRGFRTLGTWRSKGDVVGLEQRVLTDRQLIRFCESNRFASSSMLLTDWGVSFLQNGS